MIKPEVYINVLDIMIRIAPSQARPDQFRSANNQNTVIHLGKIPARTQRPIDSPCRHSPSILYFDLWHSMSLPGLDLTQATEEREFVPAPPTQISLSKGSEWRFEVAFGTTVRVKV